MNTISARQFLFKRAGKMLKQYKSIDSVLRQNGTYRGVSEYLHRQYVSLKNAQRSDIQYYFNNFDRFEVDENLVFLDCFWGRKIGCNPYAIYRELLRDERGKKLKFIWAKNKNVKAPDDVMGAPNVSFVEYESNAYSEALLKAGILISNTNFPSHYIPRQGQKLFSPWHGIPLKSLGFDAGGLLGDVANTQRNFHLSTGVFTASPYSTRKIVDAYGGGMARDSVYEIGSPRIDSTLSADPVAIRKKLEIAEDKKVLLYAPTWRGTAGAVSTDINDQIKAIKALKSKFGNSHEILVSLHHLTRKHLGAIKGISQIDDDIDINDVLAVVDILISDYSSVIFDYLVLDRPVILYVPDRYDYQDSLGFSLELEKLPFSIVNSIDGLAEAVKSSKKPSQFSSWVEIKELLIPNEDGHASKRAVDILFESGKRVVRNAKKSIAIYPGGLLANGITSSFLSLLCHIDYSKYDVFVFVDASPIDADPVRQEMLKRIDKRAQLVIRNSVPGLSYRERKIFFKIHDGVPPREKKEQKIFNDIILREKRRLVGGRNFDIAIDFSGYGVFWAKMMSCLTEQRAVMYQHTDLWAEANNSHELRNQSQLKGVFETYQSYDVFASVSKDVRDLNSQTLLNYYSDTARIGVVGNSLDTNRIYRLAAEPLALTMNTGVCQAELPDVTKFITIGRLSPEKNHMRLLQAFAGVLENGVNAVLFIVGYGPLERQLKQEAIRRGIDQRVIFTGRLSNPYALLKACDCHVLSSDYEGQGIVLLEALTLQVPCISTDIPAVHSVLGNGVGIICERTINGLKKAMIEFANKPENKVRFDAADYNKIVMREFYTEVCGETSEDVSNSLSAA